MKKKIYSISVIFLYSIISFVLGIFLGGRGTQDETNSTEPSRTSLSGSDYTFINPLLECEVNTIGAHQKYIPFEDMVKSSIKKEIIETNSGIHLSVYFRNLNNGPWFGINEDAGFSPASLMKLPILIMYLKWAEYVPDILDQKILIASASDIAQYYVPTNRLDVGKEYSTNEALGYLIAYSDNNAVGPLLTKMPIELQEKVLAELGVPSTEKAINTGREYIVSVKEYASFFRVLYNASYLNRSSSEGALRLLSESTFDTGIRSSVPKDIAIAHKFGERESEDENGNVIRQLHDCGIVYYPGYPYLLCVMTKGPTDYKHLENIIHKTSSIIYTEISNKFPKK